MRLVVFLVAFLTLIFTFFWWPLSFSVSTPTWFFYDQSGSLLYKEASQTFTPHTTPRFLKQALISLEDKDFESHWGIDVSALGRATWQNLSSDQIVSGASTISMQLARLEFLASEPRNWWYKIRQIILALKLEQQLSKTEILERYMAQVNLGNGAVGFYAGAQRYFSKSLAQLSIGEMATLLAMLQNPSLFNPIDQPALSLERRNLVLERLHRGNLISLEASAFWQAQPIDLSPKLDNLIVAPHFVFWVKQQLDAQTLSASEIHVYTTLDKNLYQDSLNIVRETIKRQQEAKKMSNAAVIVLDENNKIKLMLGSPDYFDTLIDGAVNVSTSSRQTGSVLKPFLYALALERGFSPATGLNDLKTIFPSGYLPRNFNIEEENGVVRFREALANSYNIAAVDLLNRVGENSFYNFLQVLGLDLNQPVEGLGLSMVLGTVESSLLSVTQAYSVFTHQGALQSLSFIDRVEDGKGNLLFTPEPPLTKKVLSTDSAEWAQQVLSDDVARWKNFSRGNSLELTFASGAKTGTSQGFRDNWVVGFSPQYTVGVWVGNADGTPMVASSGMQGAGPIWQRVMQRVHRERPPRAFIYSGTRALKNVCRRPNQGDCTEAVPVFLTPADLEKINSPDSDRLSDGFAIVYPGINDTFVAGSDLLIQHRPSSLEIKHYTLNGESFAGPIFKNLPIGTHIIGLDTLDGQSAIVQIQVEQL
jgi:penicillin-binding protein 1C